MHDDLALLVLDYFESGAARRDMETILNTNFVRIDPWHVVNLAQVTEVYLTHSAGLSGSRTAIVVNFVSDTPLTVYDDNLCFAMLKFWMEKQPGIDDSTDEEWSDQDLTFITPAIDLDARNTEILDAAYGPEETQ